jgi:hypothetical protein
MGTSTAASSRGTAAWQDLDRRRHLHPFTDFKSLPPRERA